MSSKRKLRRARQGKSPAGPGGRRPGADARHLLEHERFKVEGSRTLWPALLGWDPPRVARAWLLQAVHDGACSPQSTAEGCRLQVSRHAPELAERLDPDLLARALELWAMARKADAEDATAPHWTLLANLCERAGLGAAAAGDLEDDWSTWTNLTLAGAPRKALMESLAQTERAALALDELTGGENIASVAGLVRIVWSAIAYGDADTFSAIGRWTTEWDRERQKSGDRDA